MLGLPGTNAFSVGAKSPFSSISGLVPAALCLATTTFTNVLPIIPGCENQEGFCPAVVHPDDCARAYLRTLNPPECFKDFVDRVGIQQHVIERECLPGTIP
jgi:hypothetical protein